MNMTKQQTAKMVVWTFVAADKREMPPQGIQDSRGDVQGAWFQASPQQHADAAVMVNCRSACAASRAMAQGGTRRLM